MEELAQFPAVMKDVLRIVLVSSGTWVWPVGVANVCVFVCEYLAYTWTQTLVSTHNTSTCIHIHMHTSTCTNTHIRIRTHQFTEDE